MNSDMPVSNTTDQQQHRKDRVAEYLRSHPSIKARVIAL